MPSFFRDSNAVAKMKVLMAMIISAVDEYTIQRVRDMFCVFVGKVDVQEGKIDTLRKKWLGFIQTKATSEKFQLLPGVG